MKKVDTVILTALNWETMGGLPGAMLSMADSGTTNELVIGPRNLKYTVAAMRHFVQRCGGPSSFKN